MYPCCRLSHADFGPIPDPVEIPLSRILSRSESVQRPVVCFPHQDKLAPLDVSEENTGNWPGPGLDALDSVPGHLALGATLPTVRMFGFPLGLVG